MLYDELYQMEWNNLDEAVIKDNDRTDAFLYWRRKEQEKRMRKHKREERKSENKSGKFKIFSGAKKEGDN